MHSLCTRFFIAKTVLALAKMRLVTPLLLFGVCSAPCSAQIPQAVAKLANVKTLGIGSAFTGFLTDLKAVHEEIAAREDERQGVKESLRAKAHETAKFVVWYNLNEEERKGGQTDEKDFKKMLKKGKEMMQAKIKRSAWNPLNWLSSRPSSKLAEVYLQEEIARVMKHKGITMELDDEPKSGPTWPTIFAGGKPGKVETVTVKPVKALEAPKTKPEERKGLRKLLGVVVAELAVVAILI